MSETNGRVPTVAEYLIANELEDAELAEKVGVKVKTVQARKAEATKPMPAAWLRRLAGEELPPEPPPAEPTGRDDEQAPRAPSDARVETPPAPPSELDFSSLASYIESAYRGAADYVVTDPLLAAVIRDNAKKAGEAWARWAQSDPRVAAWVEKMMVATPLGEVVMVHVGIGAGYVFGRISLQRAVEEELRRQAAEEHEREPDEPLVV